MEERIQESLQTACQSLGFHAPWMDIEDFLGEAWDGHWDAIQMMWAEDHAPNH
jgi:hypothetical protein